MWVESLDGKKICFGKWSYANEVSEWFKASGRVIMGRWSVTQYFFGINFQSTSRKKRAWKRPSKKAYKLCIINLRRAKKANKSVVMWWCRVPMLTGDDSWNGKAPRIGAVIENKTLQKTESFFLSFLFSAISRWLKARSAVHQLVTWFALTSYFFFSLSNPGHQLDQP